jgi:hypothetical protein
MPSTVPGTLTNNPDGRTLPDQELHRRAESSRTDASPRVPRVSTVAMRTEPGTRPSPIGCRASRAGNRPCRWPTVSRQSSAALRRAAKAPNSGLSSFPDVIVSDLVASTATFFKTRLNLEAHLAFNSTSYATSTPTSDARSLLVCRANQRQPSRFRIRTTVPFSSNETLSITVLIR